MTESERKQIIHNIARIQGTKHSYIWIESEKELGDGKREITFNQRGIKKGALLQGTSVIETWIWVA